MRKLKTEIKELASNGDTILAAVFDLQRVLPVPFGDHSDFFYKQKLSVHDLTITNLVT